ncbi:hypothetical protein [Vibrio jasicida]|uniref:hypothetical protein n=1 Tax=Vibrio jasicida TaxID=766224 RepID=UPI0005EFB92D|nr:hypothetical protein [Vibrio jasicida]
MTLSIDEKIWAETVLQDAQTSCAGFDNWTLKVRQTVVLKISNQMRNKYTQAQFDYRYPDFNLDTTNAYLFQLLEAK